MPGSAEAKLIENQRQVPPGTFRHEVLSAARKFKTTWVELGALLVRVQKEKLYDEWGFESFESYCTRELHIRRSTAMKLTNSYSFLERHDRDNLGRPAEERPAFEVVEVLAKAEERGQLSNADYDSLRNEIWGSDKPPTQVARELTQRFPAPAPAPPSRDDLVARFAAQARRLATDMESSKAFSRELIQSARSLAEELEEMSGA